MLQKGEVSFWQWPNILSIDSALIAVAWQWIFAMAAGITLSAAAYCVLGVSVWLTYMADRLFDVRGRNDRQLLSFRHQFAKQHESVLWLIWSSLLLLAMTAALIGLSDVQLLRGFVLLGVCLAYTLLNQLLSKRFFPKELLVALIFTGGVIVFIEAPMPPFATLCFAMICFMNCLSIGMNERAIDDALQVRSVSDYCGPIQIWVLYVLAFAALPFTEYRLAVSLGFVMIALFVWLIRRHKFKVETYRVVLDASLLIGILPWLFN